MGLAFKGLGFQGFRVWGFRALTLEMISWPSTLDFA